MTSDNLSVEFQRSAVKSKLSKFADLHLQFVHRDTFSMVGEIYTICKTGVSHGWQNGAYNIGDKCCSHASHIKYSPCCLIMPLPMSIVNI